MLEMEREREVQGEKQKDERQTDRDKRKISERERDRKKIERGRHISKEKSINELTKTVLTEYETINYKLNKAFDMRHYWNLGRLGFFSKVFSW